MKRRTSLAPVVTAITIVVMMAGGSTAYASGGFFGGFLNSLMNKVTSTAAAIANRNPAPSHNHSKPTFAEIKQSKATQIAQAKQLTFHKLNKIAAVKSATAHKKDKLTTHKTQKKTKLKGVVTNILAHKKAKYGHGGSDGGSNNGGDTFPIGSDAHCEIFYAGQHIEVGSVCLSFVDDMVYLDYILENGWKLSEAHAWIGDSLASAPRAGNGNPIPGQFPLKGNPPSVTTYTFSVPLSQLNINIDTVCESDLYVAAHGVVSKSGHKKTESAWAGTTRFTNKGNWATYFSTTLDCLPEEEEEEETPPPYDPDAGLPQGCFATFAVNADDDLSFASLFGAGNKGWLQVADMGFDVIVAPMATGTGIVRGELELIIDEGTLYTQLTPDSGYEIRKVYVYAGNDFSPGPASEYGLGQTGLNLTSPGLIELESNITSGMVEMVIYAEICETGAPGGPA